MAIILLMTKDLFFEGTYLNVVSVMPFIATPDYDFVGRFCCPVTIQEAKKQKEQQSTLANHF